MENSEAGRPSRVGYDTPAAADLARGLLADTTLLIRQEVALARAEIQRISRRVRADVRQIAIGGSLGAVGALVFVAFVVALLGDLLGNRYWLSALLVAIVLLLVGGFFAYAGIEKLHAVRIAPTETAASLRETARWARHEAAEIRTALSAEAVAARGNRHLASPARAVVAPTCSQGTSESPRARDEQQSRHRRQKHVEGGLLRRVAHEFTADDVAGQAARVAYYAFLALPPAFLVLFGLTGFFGGAGVAEWLTRQLSTVLPESASELINEFVQQVVYDNAPGPFTIGLLLALWASSNMFMALGNALNVVYDVENDRSWVKQRLLALGVMILTVLLLLGGSALLLMGPQIAGALDLFGAAETIWAIVQWPLALLLVLGALWIIYYLLPARDQSHGKKILLAGAAAAAVLWVLATAAFRIYIANFSSYSETYGFLGAVIVLLLWLYVTGLVILLGGELNSEMERTAAA